MVSKLQSTELKIPHKLLKYAKALKAALVPKPTQRPRDAMCATDASLP
jgi:hypothetical protein